MNQILPVMSDDDDDDEPTLSYSHSEIQRMREPKVRLEDFLEFGNSGTPPGMIGSRNETSLMVVGVCGDVGEHERTAHRQINVFGSGTWGPLPSAANTRPSGDVPLARGAEGWAPAQAEPVAAPPEADAGSVSVDEDDDELLALAGIGRQRLVVLVGVVLAVFLLGGMTMVFSRGAEDEPPTEEVADAQVDVPAPEPVDPPPPPPEDEPREREPGDHGGEELVPTVEPPEDDPKPAPRQSKAKKKKKHETPQCAEIRSNAKQSKKLRDWAGIERKTRGQKNCWANKNEYRTLRMLALFELERNRECIQLGEGSSTAAVKELREACENAQAN